MSQSVILSLTDSTEASNPELEASSDQRISLSGLSPSLAANDEADETPSAHTKETAKEDSLIRFRRWISENKMAVAGWIVALLSLVVTLIAMVPSFRSESMSQRALELAEWTALKDFIENCMQDHQVGLASVACQEAIAQPLPPPPHVRIAPLIIKRRMDDASKQRDGSSYLKMAADVIIPYIAYVASNALVFYTHRVCYKKFSICFCVKNHRFLGKNFAEKISKIPRYDAHGPLDAQVAEVRSEHRFECVLRAGLAIYDRIETIERGQYVTVPRPDEIASLHAATLIYIEARVKGLMGLVNGFLALAMCIYTMAIR